MQLLELLSIVSQTANEKGLSTPFICGGSPRDKVLNKIITDISDIDITTGDQGSIYLPKELALKLGLSAHYKQMEDGHAQITINDLKLDFSSNYRAPNIRELLQKAGIVNPTEMQQELYSRDFTCNALLMTMDLKTIKDPTGLGIKDIKNKILRTCLPAKYTLENDHKRIVRIIYLAAKLNFEVDNDIINWVKNHPQTIADAKPKYIAKKLQKAINYNIDKTIELLDLMQLWHFIPILPDLVPYISQKPGRL